MAVSRRIAACGAGVVIVIALTAGRCGNYAEVVREVAPEVAKEVGPPAGEVAADEIRKKVERDNGGPVGRR